MIRRETFEEYKANPALNFSSLKLGGAPSPETSSSMILGTAVHHIVLEPEKFNEKFFRMTLNKSAYNALQIIKEKLLKNPVIRSVISSYDKELSFYVKAPNSLDSLDLKARFDLCNPSYGVIGELKTCHSIKLFQRNFTEYLYGYAAGFYSWVYSLEFKKPKSFVFIIQETTTPYNIGFIELKTEQLEKYSCKAQEMVKDYLIDRKK